MIPFNIPPYLGSEDKYINDVISRKSFSGNGVYTKKCEELLEKKLDAKKVLLTTSCTHALEMSALLIDIKEGDEIIMSSYTFVSTANAFVLRGAKIVFVEINPSDMNINENKIEAAITEKTKAIVAVHYGGNPCEMDTILDIAKKHALFVIEDAAQGLGSFYKGKALGTIGDIGTFSFHETKNITSAGEGGALIINNDSFIRKAEIIREKGTNRSLFFKGLVDKYTWVSKGSNYLLSEISAAFLFSQLENLDKINTKRLNIWNEYKEGLFELEKEASLELNSFTQNAHMFYIKLENQAQRDSLISFLKSKGVQSTFHFVPLHSSDAGKEFGIFLNDEGITQKESQRLLRLPLYYEIKSDEIKKVIQEIKEFYKGEQ